MSKICEICGKRRLVGNSVSHADNKTKKYWQPNLQKIRVRLDSGEVKRMKVCTSCIRSGKVQKAAS